MRIEAILFEGNKRTKENVIRRELNIQEGDVLLLSNLDERLEFNRQRIQNTTLFSKVEVNISSWSTNNRISITFTVREQWYLTGYLIFDLADRNFNVWWEEMNRSLDRVNYGFRMKHDNLTGNADEISVGLTLGYTRQVDLKYELPGFNKKRTLGFRSKISFSQNRETNYTTEQNKFLFYRNDDFQLQTFVGELGLQYRKRLDVYHLFDLEYYHNQSSDSLVALNSDFFLKNKTDQKAFALSYSFVVDKRRERPYAKKGWYLKSILRKDGIGLFSDRDAFTLNTTLAKYLEFSPRWSLELIGKLFFYLNRKKQPYYNSRSFGFRPDYLSGYELYVVDGMDFSYLKSSLRYQLFDFEFDIGWLGLLEKMRLLPVPIQVYLTANNDIGYVNDPYYAINNPLSNEFSLGWRNRNWTL